MGVIKVNYDNAAVKLPARILPSFFCSRAYVEYGGAHRCVLRVEIDPKTSEEPFWESYLFEVYVNGKLEAYVNANTPTNEAGRHVVEIVPESMSMGRMDVSLSGTYRGGSGNERTFQKDAIPVLTYLFCDEDLTCGEDIAANDAIYGYLVGNSFYLEREGSSDPYSYDGLVDPTTFVGDFVDLPSGMAYEWDGETGSFALSYR